jgi:hypothetical protein
MLGRMDVTVAMLRALDALQGFTRTDAELEAALPLARRMLEVLATLDAAPVDAVTEPTTQFRII